MDCVYLVHSLKGYDDPDLPDAAVGNTEPVVFDVLEKAELEVFRRNLQSAKGWLKYLKKLPGRRIIYSVQTRNKGQWGTPRDVRVPSSWNVETAPQLSPTKKYEEENKDRRFFFEFDDDNTGGGLPSMSWENA